MLLSHQKSVSLAHHFKHSEVLDLEVILQLIDNDLESAVHTFKERLLVVVALDQIQQVVLEVIGEHTNGAL